MNLTRRPRRNRKSEVIRNMVQENFVTVNDLIFPIFVVEGQNQEIPITSMPGISRFSADRMMDEIAACVDLGVKAFAPFPVISENKKDRFATESFNKEGLFPSFIAEVKKNFPDVVLMTDVAMDPYSSDGHDGIVDNGEILNDATLDILAKMALEQARAGADIIGPSDMMDGRVGFIREHLDKNGFSNVAIMSYTAKYASAFYGPFRDALNSAPKFGDKKSYQMNPANQREALIEAALDEAEGADFLMVKPGLPYLDVIKLLKDNTELPVAAYNVSGEYAMIKAAVKNGWLNEQRSVTEVLTSFRRAGASAI